MTLQRSENHYREITHSQTIGGFTLTEAVYAPNLSVRKHSHRLDCFGLVLQGTYIESYGKKSLECKPLHLKFRPAEEIHTDFYGTPAVKCFFVEPAREWMQGVQQYSAIPSEPSVFRSDSLLCLLMKVRREALQPDLFSQLVIEGVMLEVIAETCRVARLNSASQSPRWLKHIRDILHDRFNEPLTLSEIGKCVGIHPVHVASVFRERYGCSVGTYLRQLRIEFACRKISTSNAPLAEVALAAGFAHQSQFSRTFKRVMGLTPAQYRSTTQS